MLVAAILALFIPMVLIRPVEATCRKVNSQEELKSCAYTTKFKMPASEIAQCKPEDVARLGTQTDVEYDICCTESISETYSFFSLKAALCGSSDERGPNNATCWTCGGDLRCTGSGQFALGSSDSIIAPPISQRQPVNPGDTNTDQVWRVPSSSIPSNGFTYNGLHYDKPPGDLIVCTSDARACGADSNQVQCSGRFAESNQSQNTSSADEVVEVVGDTVHEKIEIPEILTGITNFFPVFRPAIAHFILNIWPKDDTFQSPNLEWLSNQMYQANFGPLNTKYHQDRTVHMAKLQPYSTTARLCVTNPDNGDLYTTVSEQRYESKTSVPFLLKGIEGSRGLASKMTKHREADQDFDDKQTVKIKTDEPLPCGTIDVAQNLINEPVGTINQNVFGQNTVSGAIPWLINVSIGFAFKIEDLLNNLFRFRMEIPGYVLKTQLIRSAELDCYTGHCETADLGRVNYVSASEKQELVSSGGIVETFKPLSHSLPGPIHGGVKNQQFATTNLGDKTAETRIWGLNRTTEAGIYFNCMIAPLSKQAELIPVSLYPPTANNPNAKSACSQKWEGEKPPPNQ